MPGKYCPIVMSLRMFFASFALHSLDDVQDFPLRLFDCQAVHAHRQALGAKLFHQRHDVWQLEASPFEQILLREGLARRSIADAPSLVHDEHVVGQPRDIVHIMGD